MLLTADDNATFTARITQDDSRVWASYLVEGRIKGDPVQQSDKRMFASEQEARAWLVGEGEQRGFEHVEVKVAPGAD
jgi:hypothetical protein